MRQLLLPLQLHAVAGLAATSTGAGPGLPSRSCSTLLPSLSIWSSCECSSSALAATLPAMEMPRSLTVFVPDTWDISDRTLLVITLLLMLAWCWW